MRIAQVSPYSLTMPGGVQSQVLGLARSLRALGHDTRVLGPCDGAPPEPGVVPLGASVPLATNGSVAAIAPDVSCVLRTMRALRDGRYDVVHIHEPLVPGPAATALVVSDAAVVATFHRAGDSKAYTWLKPLARWGIGKAHVRVAVSQDAKATAERALGGVYEVAFNGIDVERFSKAQPRDTNGRPTIFFLGRHEPRKGLAVLLEAMRSMPSDVTLWVAGDGPQTAELRSATAGDRRIEWLGRISDAEVARRFAGADVYCAPSLGGESFGVVLLEAMAAGAPVVASNLAGYRGVVRSGVEGLLVPPGDPHALAEALSAVLRQPALADQLTDGCEARALSFSMEALAERYVEIYARALDLRTRSR